LVDELVGDIKEAVDQENAGENIGAEVATRLVKNVVGAGVVQGKKAAVNLGATALGSSATKITKEASQAKTEYDRCMSGETNQGKYDEKLRKEAKLLEEARELKAMTDAREQAALVQRREAALERQKLIKMKTCLAERQSGRGKATMMYFEWRRYGANQVRCRRIKHSEYKSNYLSYLDKQAPRSLGSVPGTGSHLNRTCREPARLRRDVFQNWACGALYHVLIIRNGQTVSAFETVTA
jgi:hypothetical protein